MCGPEPASQRKDEACGSVATRATPDETPPDEAPLEAPPVLLRSATSTSRTLARSSRRCHAAATVLMASPTIASSLPSAHGGVGVVGLPAVAEAEEAEPVAVAASAGAAAGAAVAEAAAPRLLVARMAAGALLMVTPSSRIRCPTIRSCISAGLSPRSWLR